MRLVWFFFITASVALLIMAWADDAVTLEGHWTIYTARCEGGEWSDAGQCSGQRVAAQRHDFISNPAATTVEFEIKGHGSVTGVLSGCAVQDGRNWTCLACSGGTCPLTRALVRGEPKLESTAAATLRPIAKWRWHCLRLIGRAA
jgi:hypothetical protein